MMNDALCTYEGRRDEVLVAYLYDDIDPVEREAFDRHLQACLPCRAELQALGDVRDDLAAWVDPVVAEGVGGTAPRAALRIVNTGNTAKPQGGWRVIADAPIWMQAAVAMLVVAALLGLANINLTYSRQGLTLTTGWLRPAAAPIVAASAPASPSPATAAPAAASVDDTAQLRAEIAALRQQLDDVKILAASADPTPAGQGLMKQVRAQIQESEKRQQSELALRVAEVSREFHSLRQADLANIDRNLGLIQNRTGLEVLRWQQQFNNLAQKVSQQR